MRRNWHVETPHSLIAASVAFVMLAGAPAAPAQHVTPAMMATSNPDGTGCEDQARQATTMLDVLNANLERARLTNNETEMRAAVDALQKGFGDVKGRLARCRASATAPAGAATPPAPTPQQPAAPAAGATDHAAMGHAAPAGTAGTPSPVRQVSGPAEAALQAFQDALQVGNREVALQWLAPDATVTEAGVTDQSRDAYAKEHMGIDMAFLKTARIGLLDRQVHPSGDSTHIVSTSRVTGRAGELPVDVTITEGALLKRTPQGWRIVSLQWTVEPVKADAR